MKVELEWLKFIASEGMIKRTNGVQLSFSADQLRLLDSIIDNFDLNAASRIKTIEQTTNHDVKAVEYFIKEKISSFEDKGLHEIKEYVHFCCTSEDINNLSYALMLTDSKNHQIVPLQAKILQKLSEMAVDNASVSMLSRTHGQSASPTTLGKEIANFVYRLNRQNNYLKNHRFAGKINGAVGNFNAHYFVYPEYNWAEICNRFVEKKLNLEYNPYTTQIEPHDSLAEFFSHLNLFNTILIGLSQDFWHYISLGYFLQKTLEGEVGSSTMPHKVNPIDFENCEGNLGLSNGLSEFVIRKLLISRFQRDLSDSTVLRNLGSILGYSMMAYQSLNKGLGKLKVNKEKIDKELNDHWEVLAEPIQMLLRKLNVDGAYEQLKALTRGKNVRKEDIEKMIEDMKVEEGEKKRLRELKVWNYVGKAEEMAKNISKHTRL